jgi:cholest-4-en-3-one 26-monooxygenase
MDETLGRCPVLHAHSSTSAAAEPSQPGARELTLPAGVDLADPETYVGGVPHEAFLRLRREAPVSWQDERQGTGFWSITRYHDLIKASRDFRAFSSSKKAVFLFDSPPEDLERMQLMMLNMDPPRHTKLRGLVNRGFTPVRVAQLERHVREICARILDNVARRGECDFVKDVAAELPLQVIAELMGIPLEEREMVFDWSNRLIGFDDPEFQTSMEDGKLAAAEMYVYANQLAEARRTRPKDDLVSVLMQAEVEGEKLSELEFDLFFLLLAVAGNETTRNLISGGTLKLIENPAERARLLADPALLPTAIEEMLRTVSPVMHFRRTATHDVELHGEKIREGDKVILWYISANRDEDVFAEPERFDVGRTPNEHLAFGIGQHFCLGANLARLEIRIMFEELLRRLPDIELAGPIRRLRSNFINGIKSMPVRFTPERI